MTDSTTSAANAAKLEKQLRVLQRKLERSEWHRVDLENQHDRDQHLYRRLQADLEAAHREAQIEAALERVRSRAMAMRSPADLSVISETVFTELKALGFADLRNTEIIINHETGSFVTSYYYSDYGVSGVIDIDYRTNPIVDAWARAMRTADDAFSEIVVGEDEIEDWRTYRLSLGYAPDPKLDAASVVYHYSYSIGLGALSISSFEPVPAEQLDVLAQFRNVFHLAYQRYADIARAEAQAREAQIQLALERVRTQSMLMQHSSELVATSSVFHEQLLALGIPSEFSYVWLPDEAAGKHQFWATWATEEDGGPVHQSRAITYDLDKEEPYTAACFAAWESDEKLLVDFIPPADIQRFFDIWEELLGNAEHLSPERYPDGLYYAEGYMAYGCFGINIRREPTEEELGILRRFAVEFERAYRRFLDLQRAEAQAREAQIEAGLERVRARSMAMHESAELLDVVPVVYQQLDALGLLTEGSDVELCIIDEETGVATVYQTDLNYSGEVRSLRLPLTGAPYPLDEQYRTWKRTPRSARKDIAFTFKYEGEDWENLLQFTATLPDWAEMIAELRAAALPHWWMHNAYFAHGFFTVQGTEALDAEGQAILQRFVQVFEQTHTRFLDLQRAEAQAREAEIEASLERVRSRAMALRSSDELREMVLVILEEMKALAFPSGRCTIVLFDEETGDSDFWMSGLGDGDLPERYRVPYHELPTYLTLHEGWRRGTPFFEIELAGEVKREQDRFFHEETEFRRLPEAAKEGMRRMGDVWLSNAATTHGVVQAVGTEPLSDENAAILQRFAKVIDLTYTRVEDIQQAEEQAREAEIELALERVRARTMAMQESTEISEVAAVLYQQIEHLGAQLWGAGFAFCAPDSDAEEFWFVNAGGILPPVMIPHTEDEVHRRMYEGWQQGRSLHSEAAGGAELEAHYAYMLTVPDVRDFFQGMLDAGVSFPTWQKWHAAYFSHGYLLIITLEPFEEEHVFARFAKAFEQAYVRFLDLERAEAQAREAEIEAALERVRGRTMAMRSSDELPQAANLLFEQIHALGMPAWSAGYCIWDDDKRGITAWMSSEGVLQPPFHAPLTEDPYFMGMREGYERGVPLHVHDKGGKELVEHYEYMRTLPVVGEILDSIIEAGHPLPTYQINHCAYFSHGFLLFITYEPVPEAHPVFERFAKVFEQTYTRYLDLKQAEAQAREAQIEAAMERVRSRALAMTTSEELLDVVFKIHQEFAGLGLPCEQFWHTRYTPEVYQKALTGVGGEKLAAVMELPRDFSSQPALAAWERGDEKIGVFMFDADAACTYLHHMVTKGRFDEVDPEGITEEMVRENGGFTFVQARTSHGEIGYTLWGETEPSEEAKDVLVRFTGAFDLAYRRFEDLQQAEQQAALDRVRAEIASTLTSDADVTGATFDPLEAEIRTLFGRSGLRLGLATLPADGELNVRSGRRIWNSLVIRDALGEGRLDWRGTLYETAMQGEQAIAIPDVEDDGSLDEGLREQLLAQGVQSLALQPLRTGDRTVGLFELSSPESDAVDDATLLTMTRLAPTFALAVTQNLEGFETRVESALQHAYTAIHPSVRWRFRDAAIEMLERGDETAEAEPIVFEALYPLYGAADIRASTRHRNEAVRHDALARLGRARDALAAIHQALPLTILDELGLRVRKRIDQYERVWNTGDEAAADRFLTEDVEPVLERMTAGRADLAAILEAHRAPDEEGAVLRSDAYEASRRAINRAVSDVLLAEEAETQRLFPHYLELTRTDGVEHTMYIGPSIAPDRPFDLAYVENLRLRQLIAACAVAREVRRLGETLPMPLAIAQLVVVQHAPITLRFRADEKRFDVDSPSGVRFELLKKRLDKACVKGTEERITQPDQIAVVYSTESEEAEYRRYAEYLAAQGQIEAEVETLEVEDLPDAAGLRMLRLKVASSGS